MFIKIDRDFVKNMKIDKTDIVAKTVQKTLLDMDDFTWSKNSMSNIRYYIKLYTKGLVRIEGIAYELSRLNLADFDKKVRKRYNEVLMHDRQLLLDIYTRETQDILNEVAFKATQRVQKLPIFAHYYIQLLNIDKMTEVYEKGMITPSINLLLLHYAENFGRLKLVKKIVGV